MSEIRKFGSAAREARDNGLEDKIVTVDVLGRTIDIESPGSGQMAILTMALSARDDVTQIGGFLSFMLDILDPDDGAFLQKCLQDRHSGFDAEDLVELAEFLIEEWSARPTRKPSDYAPKQQRNGASSTAGARRRASTRSGSRSAGS